MSLSTYTLTRLPYIKQGFRKGLSRTQIGLSCKEPVTEKTIDRDMKAWVTSGQFEIWLKEEFAELHHYAREANPMEAYKEISKIVGRMITHKTEIKSEHKEEVTHKIVDMNKLLERYEQSINRALKGNIRENHLAEQVDNTQANSEAS